jgi:TonB family protein
LLRPRQPGGGLQGGRGGIEGEPIPLNTTDPNYNDYFEKLRRQIQDKWSYPLEAGDKNIGGSLLIEFGIRRDGKLQFIELRRSSGTPILDLYAMNAVKLASPFPPVPEPLVRGTGIPVGALFNYIVVTGSLNKLLR